MKPIMIAIVVGLVLVWLIVFLLSIRNVMVMPDTSPVPTRLQQER